MRTRSARRSPLVALGTALLLIGLLGGLLSGCGTVPPGTASVIDGSKISRSDVTELAEAQCAGIKQAAQNGQAQSAAAPRKQLLRESLTLLMDIELSLQYGKSEDVTPRPEAVAATYAQVEEPIKALPEKYHDFMAKVFLRWASGRDVMTQIGERATGQQPTASNADALLQAGYQKREPWLSKVDIDTDPRYGLGDLEEAAGSDPSVSEAVSGFAKEATNPQPAAAWVSALPSSQKCG